MKFPHFKIRNPLMSAAPKFRATTRIVWRDGHRLEFDIHGKLVKKIKIPKNKS